MRTGRLKLAAAGAVVLAVTLAAAFAERGASAPRARPNIVFVLTDDLSWNLVRFMPHVRQMEKEGVTFSRYFVTDSLCCPSRASIFTGRYPHNTQIFTNTGKYGGFPLFHSLGEESSTFATRLHAAGYLTAMMGKYMNGYRPMAEVDGRTAYIPPGWDEWDVAGNAYTNFNYALNENRRVVGYGHEPSDYLTDVLAQKGSAFIARAAIEKHKPFLLEIATFAPHSPYTPAPRHSADFPRLHAPRTPAFNEANVADKPIWLRAHASLRRLAVDNIDAGFRKRAQAVESVDELLAKLQDTLAATHQLSNTYIVFSSDNGYHMGEHRLTGGKMTAFETDIRVPLMITGPGVPHNRRIDNLAENVDLYPTFVRLAGGTVPPTVDGRSLAPLWGRTSITGWRKAVLVEHKGPDRDLRDPDFPPPNSGNPISYKALRTGDATYVEYAGGELEYYDLKHDRYELSNTAGALSLVLRGQLHARLAALAACHGAADCWRAAGGS